MMNLQLTSTFAILCIQNTILTYGVTLSTNYVQYFDKAVQALSNFGDCSKYTSQISITKLPVFSSASIERALLTGGFLALLFLRLNECARPRPVLSVEPIRR